MDYTINPHALTIKIGNCTFEKNGEYFDENDDHSMFYNFCNKMQNMINYLFENKVFIHLEIEQNNMGSCGEMTLYTNDKNIDIQEHTMFLVNHINEVTPSLVNFKPVFNNECFYCDDLCNTDLFNYCLWDLKIKGYKGNLMKNIWLDE